MADILDQLKEEHDRLIEAFKEIRDMGSLTQEAQARLFRARDLLLSHIEREDKELYPALRQVAERDAEVKALLDQLEGEMGDVSKAVSLFFTTHRLEGGPVMFKGSVASLCTTVLDRIQKEERLLLPAYARHVRHKN